MASTQAPFGNPEGARSGLEEMLSDFVPLDSRRFGEGIGFAPEDLSARIIVGAKGSGKTVYLRRSQAAASENVSVYTDYIQQDLPTTSNIVKFCQMFRSYELTEKWQQLWRRAIFRSLVSHILHAPGLAESVRPDHLRLLLDITRNFLPESRTPLTAYSQITDMITSFHTAISFTRYFDDARWAELESILSDTLKTLPPICLYIDSVDEVYANAPMFWLRCQQGLFYSVMALLRDSRIGGRLHVFTCIRDQVLSSILRTEHATRFKTEPHIRILNWDFDSISYFLDQKIRRLPRALLVRTESSEDLITRWLGHQTITNVIRGIEEDCRMYLIRHTRMLPRDMIILGNELSIEISKLRARDQMFLPQEVIRYVVSKCARVFCGEQLQICANQIAADSMPSDAIRKEYADLYTGDVEYRGQIERSIVQLISAIGKDRFSWRELETAKLIAKDEFQADTDLFSVLWQNGLVGYKENDNQEGREKFYNLGDDVGTFQLPDMKPEYVFHSSLIDQIGIAPIGAPVLGF